MEFLLVNPITGKQRMPAYFPLGLGYIAQVLLDEGHRVRVMDINAHRWSPEEVVEQLGQAHYDVAGITGMVTEFPAVNWLCRMIKVQKPAAPIILGGGLPTAFPRLVLEKTPADIAVVGEGEVTIAELARGLAAGTSLSEVKGIWFRDQGQLRATEPRELIEDLDILPLPARHLFPMERYMQNPVTYLRMFDPHVVSTNMVSSRGCPYQCSYCFHGLWGNRFRARSASNVVMEMRALREKYGITGIFFMDDTFVLDRKRLLAICDQLIHQDLGIIWVASGRVNLMDEQMLSRMRSAGCRAVIYGIESGSQVILNEMRKGVQVAQASQAILDTWRAGILPVGYLMIGMPSETHETVAETVRFCRETGLVSRFSFATPFPGTELYAQAQEMGLIKTEDANTLLEGWQEWSDRILVNLSRLPDEELRAVKRHAERQIFWGDWWRKLGLYVRILGLRNTVREVFQFVRKALRIGRYT